MQSIQTRFYTNLMLTVIALLLGILTLQPYVKLSTEAQAQGGASSSFSRTDGVGSRSDAATAATRDARTGEVRETVRDSSLRGSPNLAYGGDQAVATATRELANATGRIADAMNAMAKSQQAIADSVGHINLGAVPAK